MRVAIVVGALVVTSTAGAAPIIGGSDAPAGMWPDVAAVYFPDGSAGSDRQECTGTLVAPTVVLTAGHCAIAPLPDRVLVGTNDLDHPERGQLLAIAKVVAYPDAEDTEDLGVLVLGSAASVAPRAIATGWARLDIANGAAVELVGYGTIDAEGTMQVPQLQEAATTITDADCATMPGCHTGAQPAGELGAGGGGIDTCPGDSGGPLYLLTSYGAGAYLAGVTSRGYAGQAEQCGGGGIYERPDAVIARLEDLAATPLTHGPEPELDAPLVIESGAADAEAVIAANDPLGSAHQFAIKTPPVHGTASVNGDGRLRVCASGSDSVTVTVTDARAGARAVDATFPIAVSDATGADSCDVGDGAGCCAAGGSGGAGGVPLAAGVLAILRRRRYSR